MNDPASVVYVVDDDKAVREGLDNLFRSVGYQCRCFASVDEFMQHDRDDHPACLVLDVRMPGRSGLDFQRDLCTRKDSIPVIFLTGHGDVPMSVQAMKAGAVEFLLKPFREQALLDAVQTGLGQDAKRRASAAAVAGILESYRTLLDREREILHLAADGHQSREIAERLGLKEITIKVNRARAMKKMEARSMFDLYRKIAVVRQSNADRPI